MKIDSEQPGARPIEAFGVAISRKLTRRWRKAADAINKSMARLPAIWLRILLLLPVALFGAYCLGLITGFL